MRCPLCRSYPGGKGDILIKGMLQTGTLLKAVVHRETGIRASQVMSHVAILDVPRYHKLLFITDGGMVVAPNLEQKGHILKKRGGLLPLPGL